MEIQIRKALQQIVNSFQADNTHFYKHLASSLEKILTTLQEEQQVMKEMHNRQIDKLKKIINQKQIEIDKLKGDSLKSMRKIGNGVQNQTMTATPYKILLKTCRNNHHQNSNINANVNKQNMLREVQDQIDEAFSGINISDKKQYRLSLQIGPSGLGKMSGKHITSSIKNKIVNQKQQLKLKEVLSPRQFADGNQSKKLFKDSHSMQVLRQRKISEQSSLSKILTYRQRQQFIRILENEEAKQQRQNRLDGKNLSIQQKTKLCRKPSNKSKRQLLKKRQTSTNCQTNRVRCVDIAVPIKTISVTSLKPR